MDLPELIWKFRSRERMTAEMSDQSSRWNKLRHFWRFPNDWKTLCLLDLCTFFAAFRFSAWLGWSSRSAQTCQQFVHPAPHLLRGRLALLVFPRTQLQFDQITCQHQMVMDNGDYLCPTLELFWRAQAGLRPHQRLFVKTVAVL